MPSPPPVPMHTPMPHTPVARNPMPYSPPPARFVEPEPDEIDSRRRARFIYLAGAAIGLAAGIIYMLAG